MLAKALVMLGVGSLLLAAVPGPTDPPTDPAAGPTFSDPGNITNPFTPFRPGATKVHSGRRPGARTIDVESHREETRLFSWDGAAVECRIVEQQEFANGVLEEITVDYLAQADDGHVYCFGEVAEHYENGEATGIDEDSWLVGGPTQADDPHGVQAVDAPAMFMPADLHLGDVIHPVNAPGRHETLTVVQVDVAVHTPAGDFAHAVVVAETEPTTTEPGEYRWLVPGVGTVKTAGRDGGQALIAGSLVQQELGTGAARLVPHEAARR